MNENTALGKLIEVPLLVSIKIQTEGFAQVLPRFKTVIRNQMNLEKVNTNQLFSEHSALPERYAVYVQSEFQNPLFRVSRRTQCPFLF